MRNVNVGILGSGDVGKALARGFAGLGHEVKIGSRTPSKLDDFVKAEGARISSGTFEETARFGDLLVLATLGAATEEAIEMAGIDHFDGKVVIDTTNPLQFAPGKPPSFFVGHDDSLGERIQRLIPKARVVKAFNTVGNPLMVHPKLPGGPPDMFLCGNDEDAKKTVGQICQHFGWGVIDVGGIESSRYLEPMCLVWVLHGMRTGTWMHAFKMLHQ